MKEHVRKNAPRRFDIDIDTNPFRLKSHEEEFEERNGMSKEKFVEALRALDPQEFMSHKKSQRSPQPKQFKEDNETILDLSEMSEAERRQNTLATRQPESSS